MKPAKNIEKLIKNIDIDTNAKMDEVVLNDVMKALEKPKKAKSAIPQPSIWRTIMKSRITKPAAAAAVITIAVLIAISSLNGTSAWAKVIKAIKETIYTVEDRVAMEKINRPDLKDKPSGPERIRAHHETLQIPDEELTKLSTEELVDKVTSSSLFVMMIAFPEPDGGLSRYAKSYNGVKEFLERTDAAKVLLQTYRTLSKQVSEVERDNMYTFRFAIMEVLMSSEQVMNQLNDDGQREELIAAIIKSLDARAQYDISQPEPVYGEATLRYSALAIARYLDLLGDPQYKNWYVQKRETGLFVKRAAKYAESKEIVNMARKFVQKQETERKTPSP